MQFCHRCDRAGRSGPGVAKLWTELRTEVARSGPAVAKLRSELQSGLRNDTHGWLEFLERRLRPLLHPGDNLILGLGPWWTPQLTDLPALRTFMHGVKRLVGPNGRAIFKSCPRGSVFFR